MDISVVQHDEMTDALCHEIAGFVAPRNGQPTQHIGYLGVGAAALAVGSRRPACLAAWPVGPSC